MPGKHNSNEIKLDCPLTHMRENAQALEDHLEKSQSHPKGRDNELAY